MRVSKKDSGSLLSRIRQTRGVTWLATAFVTACLLLALVHTATWGTGRTTGRHVLHVSAAPATLMAGLVLVYCCNG